MPELPDIVVYIEALAPRVLGQPLDRVRLASPFLLRSVAPPLSAAFGRRVVGLRRLLDSKGLDRPTAIASSAAHAFGVGLLLPPGR